VVRYWAMTAVSGELEPANEIDDARCQQLDVPGSHRGPPNATRKSALIWELQPVVAKPDTICYTRARVYLSS
jgi:hypothetical protein